MWDARSDVYNIQPVFVMSSKCCGLKNCTTNFHEHSVGVKIKFCSYLPKMCMKMKYFALFLDPDHEPCIAIEK